MPSQIPLAALANGGLARKEKVDEHEDDLSRTAAIILLLISTGLVALCAEFMVDSINGLVASSTSAKSSSVSSSCPLLATLPNTSRRSRWR